MPDQRCAGCGRKVRWAKMPSGKSAPFDAEPHRKYEKGMYALDGKVARIPTDSDKQFFVSHFATCPHATQFRSARKGRGGQPQ